MKKTLLIIVLILSIFTLSACNKETDPEKSFTVENAQEKLLAYFNNETGINFNLLDTVKVEEKGKEVKYYKFDVRKHNEGGANSRLDVYYIKVDKDNEVIYDIETFKEKFGKE